MSDTLQFTMVIISLLLIFVVLIQNKNVSLNLTSMSGGMGENVKRGPEKVLDMATKILGTIFILNAVRFHVSIDVATTPHPHYNQKRTIPVPAN